MGQTLSCLGGNQQPHSKEVPDVENPEPAYKKVGA